jgi:hypothetical protein
VNILERIPANTNFANQKNSVHARLSCAQNTSKEQKEFDNQKPFVSFTNGKLVIDVIY